MTLEAGDAVKGSGLAGAIAKARRRAYGKKYSVKKDAKGVNEEAKAIIDYFLDNAVVVVTELPGGTIVIPEPGKGHLT